MAPEQYGPAETQYNDWAGTAVLDDPHDGIGEIAEFARVPEGWDVVAIELFGGAGDSWASVLAVERQRVQDSGGYEQLARANGGSIRVTRFQALGSDGLALLSAMKQWSIHVMPASFSERGIALLVERDAEPGGGDPISGHR